MKSYHYKFLGSALVWCMLPELSYAQWTVKQSDFIGSPLEQVYKTSPYLVHVMPDEQWNSSNFASSKDMEWYKDARYGMYIHFGLSTFKNRELSWGTMEGIFPDMSRGAYPKEEWTSWPDSLILNKFSAESLADIIRRSGMRYVMVVAKHHDGFHLYDTKYSDFNIMHTPYGKDFVGEVIKACRMAKVKVGIYFSQRDWYHPDYEPIDTATAERHSDPPYFKVKEGQTLRQGKNHRKYIDYMFNTIRELCTNYGKIDMFNFDAAYWNGMFTADMWEAERLTRMIRELQPGILINNRSGLPGDYDSPEQRIGMYQDHRMWETCMCLCDTWAYSPSRVKEPEEIFHHIQSATIGNGNLLLSWGMKWDGEWDYKQKEALTGAGDLLKKYGKSIYQTHGGPWLPTTWGGSTFKGKHIYLHIFHPESGIIKLPLLHDNRVKYVQTLTGQEIGFTATPDGYELDCRKVKPEQLPLIIELKASRPLSSKDILKSGNTHNLFDDTQTYGMQIGTHDIGKTAEKVIELNGATSLKGIRLVPKPEEKANNVSIYLSPNGTDWNLYKQTRLTGRPMDIPVCSFLAGVLKEGVNTQKVKLVFDTALRKGATCELYGN